MLTDHRLHDDVAEQHEVDSMSQLKEDLLLAMHLDETVLDHGLGQDFRYASCYVAHQYYWHSKSETKVATNSTD